MEAEIFASCCLFVDYDSQCQCSVYDGKRVVNHGRVWRSLNSMWALDSLILLLWARLGAGHHLYVDLE